MSIVSQDIARLLAYARSVGIISPHRESLDETLASEIRGEIRYRSEHPSSTAGVITLRGIGEIETVSARHAQLLRAYYARLIAEHDASSAHDDATKRVVAHAATVDRRLARQLAADAAQERATDSDGSVAFAQTFYGALSDAHGAHGTDSASIRASVKAALHPTQLVGGRGIDPSTGKPWSSGKPSTRRAKRERRKREAIARRKARASK